MMYYIFLRCSNFTTVNEECQFSIESLGFSILLHHFLNLHIKMFENFVYLLLGKDLLIYGPNTQMFKYIVGWDSKNLIALLIPNIFLIFTDEIISICMYVKAEEMAKFDIFHVIVENSVNSEFCFF